MAAGPTSAVQTDDLVADDVQGLVPTDGLVAGDTAVLDVALAFGVEVHALERGEDPLGRVDHGFLRHRVRRQGGPAWGLELAAAGLDGPAVGIGVVQVDGDHADDLAVLHIDEHGPPGRAVGESLDFSHIVRPPLALRVCTRYAITLTY